MSKKNTDERIVDEVINNPKYNIGNVVRIDRLCPQANDGTYIIPFQPIQTIISYNSDNYNQYGGSSGFFSEEHIVGLAQDE